MPVTSPDNIYYPDTSTANAPSVYTGAMADSIQAAFDVANTRIDGVEEDIEFEELPSPITANSGYTITAQVLRRQGRSIYVSITATKTTAWGTSDNIGTLNPSNLRPVDRTAAGAGYDNTTNLPIRFSVNTSGTVIIAGASGAAGSNIMVCSVSYIIP